MEDDEDIIKERLEKKKDYEEYSVDELLNEINNFITSHNIEIIIFDVDYFKFIKTLNKFH